MNIFKILPAKPSIPTIFVLAALIFGCGSYIQETIVVLDNKVQERYKQDHVYMPNDTTAKAYFGLKRKQSVIRFYTQRDYRAAWVEAKSISALGDSLIYLIKDIRYYGLLPTDYHLNEIIAESRQLEPNLIRLDALLTDAFLKISKDLKSGRLCNLDKANDDSHRLAILHQLIINRTDLKQTLEMQEPDFTGYHSLKYALKMTLDELENRDKNMVMMGFMSKDEPINKVLQSIEINLERWRRENTKFGNRYMFINIPSYLLQVISKDSVIMESKVIVGTPETPTLSISGTIDCFVVYPFKPISRKVAIDKYLPKIQKDSSFLSRNNLEVFDNKRNLIDPQKIEWKKYNKRNFPFILRKREYSETSLGIIDLYAIEFPLYIFLNDDTNEGLFTKDYRALNVGEGSIKLEKAVELAYLLYNDDKGKRAPLEKLFELKHWKAFDILYPLPVHVRYFTCEYRDNKLYQYEDVYGKDQKLIEVFYNNKAKGLSVRSIFK